MIPTKTIFGALGEEGVLNYISALIRSRDEMGPESKAILDETVKEILARNYSTLHAVIRKDDFARRHQDVAESLLRCATERAPSPEILTVIQKLAIEANLTLVPRFEQQRRNEVFTRSQRAGLKRMLDLAELYFQGAEHHGIALRLMPLIVGPSGVGKSNLARELGARLKLPVLKISFGEWVVNGSRNGTPTMQLVQQTVNKNERLLIFVDELDKIFGSDDAWSRSLLTELYGLLDRQPSAAGSNWNSALLERFRKNVVIVGAGTWQNLWHRRASSRMGFGSACVAQNQNMVAQIRKARVIPDELLYRFNPEWIVLEPYVAQDFQDIANQMKIGPAILDPIAAAESGLNFRWVEAVLVTDALRRIQAKRTEAHLSIVNETEV